MNMRFSTLLAAGLLLVPLSAAPLLAAGGSAPEVPACKKGYVYDKKTQKCVAQRGGGAIDDESLYATGRQLALAGKYDEAISVLSLVENKNDARVLNYLGYSHRKAGRLRVGLGYYEEALQIDPDYTLVREYLGEAQLQMGEVNAAKVQLGEIEKRCGKDCEEYRDLAAAIDAFPNG
ncbi:MAG: tetratricopeptide repeat protein [Rhizobiaceae bacterium]|nr:tetratricopeptide repeat protein [Rhizobiaceae bacterium]